MRDNKYITKIISGCLLGDASISIDNRDNGNAVFETTKIIDHLDYLEKLQEIISEITTTTIRKSKNANDNAMIAGVSCKTKEQYRLRTSRHPFFNSFRNRLYINNKKVIDPHYLTLLDWEMMAYWYMDDGYITNPVAINHSGKGYNSTSVAICTQGFSYGDHLVIKKAIKEKLDVDVDIKQERNRLGNLKYKTHLSRKDISKFIFGVEKYIVPSFEYKLEIKQITRLKEYNEISRMENSEIISDGDIV